MDVIVLTKRKLTPIFNYLGSSGYKNDSRDDESGMLSGFTQIKLLTHLDMGGGRNFITSFKDDLRSTRHMSK